MPKGWKGCAVSASPNSLFKVKLRIPVTSACISTPSMFNRLTHRGWSVRSRRAGYSGAMPCISSVQTVGAASSCPMVKLTTSCLPSTLYRHVRSVHPSSVLNCSARASAGKLSGKMLSLVNEKRTVTFRSPSSSTSIGDSICQPIYNALPWANGCSVPCNKGCLYSSPLS